MWTYAVIIVTLLFPLAQAVEFFFFAVCIITLAIIFAIMSYFYKYVDISNGKVDQSNNLAVDRQDHTETSALVVSGNSPEEEKRTKYTSEKEDGVPPSESELWERTTDALQCFITEKCLCKYFVLVNFIILCYDEKCSLFKQSKGETSLLQRVLREQSFLNLL